jgi:hypothetical protein
VRCLEGMHSWEASRGVEAEDPNDSVAAAAKRAWDMMGEAAQSVIIQQQQRASRQGEVTAIKMLRRTKAGSCWTEGKVKMYMCCLFKLGTRRHRIAWQWRWNWSQQWHNSAPRDDDGHNGANSWLEQRREKKMTWMKW